MIPDTDPSPSTARPVEPAFDGAFRRGKTLVWIVVGVTAALILQNAVREVRWDQWHGQTSGAVFGCLLGGWICWCAVRGGTVSTGCLTLFYGGTVVCSCLLVILIVPMVVFAVGVIIGGLVRHALHLPTPPRPIDFHAGSPGSGNGLEVLGKVAWSAFAVWVLAISKDARVYRDVRRREVADAEASSFEWPSGRR